MVGISRSQSQIDLVRQPDVSIKNLVRSNSTSVLYEKIDSVRNDADPRSAFIRQPNDEALARKALHADLQDDTPPILKDAVLSKSGHVAKNLIGLIAKEVTVSGNSKDIKKLENLSKELLKKGGLDKNERKIAPELDALVSKYAQSAGEKFINNFMEKHCYPAWLLHHENRGVNVDNKETFNQQLKLCRPVLDKRLEILSTPGKHWVSMLGSLNMLVAECSAISKTLIRHDFEAPLPPASDLPKNQQPKAPASTPAEPVTQLDGDWQRHDVRGGNENGGFTFYINNSNRNGDNHMGGVTNTITSPATGGSPAPADIKDSLFNSKLVDSLSNEQKFELAKRLVDPHGIHRVMDNLQSVQMQQSERVIEQPVRLLPFAAPTANQERASEASPAVIPHPRGADDQSRSAASADPGTTEWQISDRRPDVSARLSDRLSQPETDSMQPSGLQREGGDRPNVNTVRPVSQASTEPMDKPTTQASAVQTTSPVSSANRAPDTSKPVYTTVRTVNQWSRQNPVEVRHFAPMNQPAEAFPSLKPVSARSPEALGSATTAAIKQSGVETVLSTQDIVAFDESSITVDNPLSAAAKATSSPLPDGQLAARTILAGQTEETLSTVRAHDETDSLISQSISRQSSILRKVPAGRGNASGSETQDLQGELAQKLAERRARLDNPQSEPTPNSVDTLNDGAVANEKKVELTPFQQELKLRVAERRARMDNPQAEPTPGSADALNAGAMAGGKKVELTPFQQELKLKAAEHRAHMDNQANSAVESEPDGRRDAGVLTQTVLRTVQVRPSNVTNEHRAATGNLASERHPDQAVDTRELRARQPASAQATSEEAISVNKLPETNPADPFSITSRIAYFNQAQKSGGENTTVDTSRQADDSGYKRVYTTVRTYSEADRNYPQPKSYIPKDGNA